MKSRIKVISVYKKENKLAEEVLSKRGYTYNDVLNFIPEDLTNIFLMGRCEIESFTKKFIDDIKKTSPNVELFAFELAEVKSVYSKLIDNTMLVLMASNIDVIFLPLPVSNIEFMPIKNGEFVSE